jgi:hypothetical protein
LTSAAVPAPCCIWPATAATLDDPGGTILRVDHGQLRFTDVGPLNDFLAAAGLEVEGQWGSWALEPITAASARIVTVAARPAPSDQAGC